MTEVKRYASYRELIDDLKGSKVIDLPNTAETWSRIANKDSFDELGLTSTELKEYIEEWISNNDYTNI